MNSQLTHDFLACFAKLPDAVKEQARKCYRLWRANQIEECCGPEHRSAAGRPSNAVLARTEVYRTGIPKDCVPAVGFFVPCMDGFGIWTTARVRRHGNSAIFEFEIFHLKPKTANR